MLTYFDNTGISYALRRLCHLDRDKAVVSVEVEDRAFPILVAPFDGEVIETDAKHILLGIVKNFHPCYS